MFLDALKNLLGPKKCQTYKCRRANKTSYFKYIVHYLRFDLDFRILAEQAAPLGARNDGSWRTPILAGRGSLPPTRQEIRRMKLANKHGPSLSSIRSRWSRVLPHHEHDGWFTASIGRAARINENLTNSHQKSAHVVRCSRRQCTTFVTRSWIRWANDATILHGEFTRWHSFHWCSLDHGKGLDDDLLNDQSAHHRNHETNVGSDESINLQLTFLFNVQTTLLCLWK